MSVPVFTPEDYAAVSDVPGASAEIRRAPDHLRALASQLPRFLGCACGVAMICGAILILRGIS